jgi:hypothetical protein
MEKATKGELMPPADDTNNVEALIEAYERADSYREAAERESKEQYHNSGLTFATLYQAENIRISNLLKENELKKD